MNWQAKNLSNKLWLLNAYKWVLELISVLILIAYVIASIYNWVSLDNTFLGNLILGLSGLYIVGASISLLIFTQIIKLFVGVHDYLFDIRMKTLNPDYQIDLKSEQIVNKEKVNKQFLLIYLIVISLVFVGINLSNTFNKNSTSSNVNSSSLDCDENLSKAKFFFSNFVSPVDDVNTDYSARRYNIEETFIIDQKSKSIVNFGRVKRLLIAPYSIDAGSASSKGFTLIFCSNSSEDGSMMPSLYEIRFREREDCEKIATYISTFIKCKFNKEVSIEHSR